MIRNVVFDINGVLLSYDFTGNLRSGIMPWDLIPVGYANTTRVWKDYNRGLYASDCQAIEAIIRDDPSSRKTVSRLEYILDHKKEKVNRRLVALMRRLRKNCRIFIVTNQTTGDMERISRMDFIKETDGVIASCMYGHVKPERELYEVLISKYDVDPAETIFIDDSLANVKAAEQLGFHVIRHTGNCSTVRKLQSMLARENRTHHSTQS